MHFFQALSESCVARRKGRSVARVGQRFEKLVGVVKSAGHEADVDDHLQVGILERQLAAPVWQEASVVGHALRQEKEIVHEHELPIYLRADNQS